MHSKGMKETHRLYERGRTYKDVVKVLMIRESLHLEEKIRKGLLKLKFSQAYEPGKGGSTSW